MFLTIINKREIQNFLSREINIHIFAFKKSTIIRKYIYKIKKEIEKII